MNLTKTQGSHQYLGKRNSRGKRSLSKMHKGLDSGNVWQIFDELEKEKCEKSQVITK